VEPVDQLRAVLPLVDPASLSGDDRLALIDLAQRAFQAKENCGGGG
jgi:hypothetical protein